MRTEVNVAFLKPGDMIFGFTNCFVNDGGNLFPCLFVKYIHGHEMQVWKPNSRLKVITSGGKVIVTEISMGTWLYADTRS